MSTVSRPLSRAKWTIAVAPAAIEIASFTEGISTGFRSLPLSPTSTAASFPFLCRMSTVLSWSAMSVTSEMSGSSRAAPSWKQAIFPSLVSAQPTRRPVRTTTALSIPSIFTGVARGPFDPAAIRLYGFEVLVQLVMEAITIEP